MGSVRLEDDDRVRMVVEPAALHLPANVIHLHVDPLRLAMAANPLVTAVLNFLTSFRCASVPLLRFTPADPESMVPGTSFFLTQRNCTKLARTCYAWGHTCLHQGLRVLNRI